MKDLALNEMSGVYGGGDLGLRCCAMSGLDRPEGGQSDIQAAGLLSLEFGGTTEMVSMVGPVGGASIWPGPSLS